MSWQPNCAIADPKSAHYGCAQYGCAQCGYSLLVLAAELHLSGLEASHELERWSG